MKIHLFLQKRKNTSNNIYKNAQHERFFAIMKKREGEKSMKRENLAIFNGRIKGNGKIEKFSICNDRNKKMITVLLTDIILSDENKKETVDHAWFRINKKTNIDEIELGSIINFSCCVQPYYFAPDYKIMQGYRIRKVRHIEPITAGNGHKLPSFIDEMKVKNTLTDHLIS
jgi:hypothetical protein